MNSLFQQLSPQQQNNVISPQMTQMANMMKSANNPQQLLMNMAQNNPKTKQVLDFINKSNQSPKDLFYSMAKQKGVDPNQILNLLK